MSLKDHLDECEKDGIPKINTLVVPSLHSPSCVLLNSITFLRRRMSDFDLAKDRICKA